MNKINKLKKLIIKSMTQEERTQLIREIKELLQLDYESRTTSHGVIFDDETIKVMKSVLQKLFVMSLI